MKTFRRLISFLIPFWPQVVLAVLMGALTIAASISLMSTSAYLISMAALHPSIAEIEVAVVGVRFFGITRGVFRYLERLSAHSLTFRVLAKMRVWFYESLEPLAPARLVGSRSGDLLNRVMADVETLDNFYVRVIAPPLVAITIVSAVAVFMAAFSPLISVILLVFLLAVGVGLTVMALRLNNTIGRELTDTRAQLRVELVDNVQGMADLTAFGMIRSNLENTLRTGNRLSGIQTRMARLNGLQAGLNSLLTGVGIWLVLFVSIPLVSDGQLRGVYLAVVILGGMASFEAVQNLPQAAQLLEANLQSARRLFEVADTPAVIRQPDKPLAKPTSADLQIRNLAFAYENEKVLNGISFDVPTAKKIAIVGPSGAGKSTIVNLLMRFWEFSEGTILLDGQDIRGYTPIDVRKMISLVSQETYLFNASLKENLLLAQPTASQEEIEDACKKAEIHEFINSLPEGYQTQVGERGAQISGGERQRLAIARAILKNAPLFVFDEPTANLDGITERKLVETMLGLMENKSILWITHRLVGLEAMDEILVMDKGRFVERGTHAELLTQGGLYFRLWELQNRVLLD